MSPALASLGPTLRGRRCDLVRSGDAGLDLVQVGGAVLDEAFAVPVPGPADPVVPRGGEPTIETFVVERSGRATATGPDEAVGRWWRPAVEALAARVEAAMTAVGVELDGPRYVTASATPIDRVIDEPHLDDDQYRPEAGVGLVAIAASHRGPRLARGALACRTAVAGAPLGLDPATLTTWFAEEDGGRRHRVQATDGDRIVLFPRFGQLHAGPAPASLVDDEGSGHESRSLLVLRADTVPGPVGRPDQTRSGSGPT